MITPPSCLPKAPWVRDERDTNWKGRAGDVAHWEAALPDAEGSAFHFQHFKQQLPGMEVWLSWWISTRHSETDSSALSQFYPSPRMNNWLTLNMQMASCFMALWQWGGSRQNAWSPHGPQVWGGRGKDWRLLAPPPTPPTPALVLMEQESLNCQIFKGAMLPPPLSFPSRMCLPSSWMSQKEENLPNCQEESTPRCSLELIGHRAGLGLRGRDLPSIPKALHLFSSTGKEKVNIPPSANERCVLLKLC